jgi:hypothetical protein
MMDKKSYEEVLHDNESLRMIIADLHREYGQLKDDIYNHRLGTWRNHFSPVSISSEAHSDFDTWAVRLKPLWAEYKVSHTDLAKFKFDHNLRQDIILKLAHRLAEEMFKMTDLSGAGA